MFQLDAWECEVPELNPAMRVLSYYPNTTHMELHSCHKNDQGLIFSFFLKMAVV